VRRCGKTTLAESFDKNRVLYMDCDLPAVEDMVRDPGYTKRYGHLEVRICTPIALHP
jgi:predicted AAA+ superfamily ATPase